MSDLIARLDAASFTWISTNERLPTTAGRYICACYYPSRSGQGRRSRPEHYALRILEFDSTEGGFWTRNHMPPLPKFIPFWLAGIRFDYGDDWECKEVPGFHVAP